MSRNIILTIAILLAAAPAAAQTTDQDVRCFMVGNLIAQQEKDPAKRGFAGLTSTFFAGRLDARLTPVQLKAAVIAQSKLLKPADVGPTMNSCVARLRAKQQALQALGGPPKPAQRAK